AEVIPVRLTISPVLVGLALDSAAEMSLRHFLNFAETGAFKVGVKSDCQKHQSEHETLFYKDADEPVEVDSLRHRTSSNVGFVRDAHRRDGVAVELFRGKNKATNNPRDRKSTRLHS